MSSTDSIPAGADLTEGPPKYRLSDDEVAALGSALRIASTHMRACAQTAAILGEDFAERQALEVAEDFERLLVAGANVTRVTVRF